MPTISDADEFTTLRTSHVSNNDNSLVHDIWCACYFSNSPNLHFKIVFIKNDANLRVKN